MWETSKGSDSPSPGGVIPQKEKAGTMVPASSSTSSPLPEKDLPPLFLLRRLLRFLLGRFLLRRFFGRFLPRWLGCRFWRGSLFLGFFADDHQLLFLGFDDLFRFARQLLVIFQP